MKLPFFSVAEIDVVRAPKLNALEARVTAVEAGGGGGGSALALDGGNATGNGASSIAVDGGSA